MDGTKGCILALDPAAKTGWATSDGRHGVWILQKGKSSAERLSTLRYHIIEEAGFTALQLIAYEDASFGSRNPAVQALHNELRGVIKLVAHDLDIPSVGYKPAAIKKYATGSGSSKKDQMIRAAKTLLNIETTDDNVADALFILEFAKRYGLEPPTSKAKERERRSGGKRKLGGLLF